MTDSFPSLPYQLPVPGHLTITERTDSRGALETREHIVEPPRAVRVKWGGEWSQPALLHSWTRDEGQDRWFGCVEYDREFVEVFGVAVGTWTPASNIDPVSE